MKGPEVTEVNWRARADSIVLPTCNILDGRRVFPEGPGVLQKFAPRDGRLAFAFHPSQPHDVHNAIVSARRAFSFGGWGATPVAERKDALQRLATRLELEVEELALLECLDVGKPIGDAVRQDVPMSVQCLRFCAETAHQLVGRLYATQPRCVSYDLRRPVGVVAAIVGWNYPLFQMVQKIGPALAAGNCVVLKPSPLTPRSAVRVAELALEAGIPPGVLNIVQGAGEVGAQLAEHRAVDLVSFTGSSATAKAIMAKGGASSLKRLILECGGKSPIVVFDDCPDIGAVADAVVQSAFGNQGEVCVAGSRLLVHSSIRAELLAQVIRRTSLWQPSDPLDARARFGALVSKSHLHRVQGYLESGRRDGAIVVHEQPNMPPVAGGFYQAPVIFDCPDSQMTIAQEEIFGPVLCVLSFDTEDDAVRIANSTAYGLSATVWTRDAGRALRMTRALDAGWIVVNATATPRGDLDSNLLSIGGHKESGLDVEGGIDGLLAYTKRTAVQWLI